MAIEGYHLALRFNAFVDALGMHLLQGCPCNALLLGIEARLLRLGNGCLRDAVTRVGREGVACFKIVLERMLKASSQKICISMRTTLKVLQDHHAPHFKTPSDTKNCGFVMSSKC